MTKLSTKQAKLWAKQTNISTTNTMEKRQNSQQKQINLSTTYIKEKWQISQQKQTNLSKTKLFKIKASTAQYHSIRTQYHQLLTSTAFLWLSTIIDQPVPPYADTVQPCTYQYWPILTHHQEPTSPVRLSFVDLRWAQLYVSLGRS